MIDDPAATIWLTRALKQLSLEELMEVPVTLPSLADELQLPEDMPVQLIDRDEFLGLGATTLPETLRLAFDLEVTRTDAQFWAVRPCGFNNAFALPFIVLRDRWPLPMPVGTDSWLDAPSWRLEEIERIEIVVRRGALNWRGQPVGCVINLITRQAVESLGFLWVGERRLPRP